MRRPLAALALLLAVVAPPLSADPATDPQIPKELRQKACTDGAYLRRKKASKPAPKKAPKKKTKKDKDGKETTEEESSFPEGDGGDFADAGDDIVKFSPKGDCSGFDNLFKPGKDGKPLSDSLEIAPAAVDGKPLKPEEVSKRFVSLSGLAKLKSANPEMIKRFFDGSATPKDQDFLGKLGSGTAAQAAAMLSPDDAVVVGKSDGKREELKLSKSKPVTINGKVPALNAPLAIRPLEGPAPTPPPAYAPTESGPIRRFYNNAKAEIIDYAHGSPIADAEGEREILPNATPIMDKPGSDQSVNVPVPKGPGLNPVCEPGCYGTQKMISVIAGMGKDYDAYYKSQRKIFVGGVSKLGGGYFPPHVSHQHGIDADFPFTKSGSGFDALANAMIVAAVIRQMPDFKHINGREYILVDQSKHAAVGWGLDQLVTQGNLTPEQAARGKSVLVHWPNHNDHFHVRILP